MCMCVCIIIIISGRATVCRAFAHAKSSMPRVCVSLSQKAPHAVSSCVCVSAVAERNSLRGKKRRRVYGREEERQGRRCDDDYDDEADGGTGGLTTRMHQPH